MHVYAPHERGRTVVSTVSTVDEKFMAWFERVAKKEGYIVDVETIGEKVKVGS